MLEAASGVPPAEQIVDRFGPMPGLPDTQMPSLPDTQMPSFPDTQMPSFPVSPTPGPSDVSTPGPSRQLARPTITPITANIPAAASISATPSESRSVVSSVPSQSVSGKTSKPKGKFGYK
jgi:hypothetical protein